MDADERARQELRRTAFAVEPLLTDGPPGAADAAGTPRRSRLLLRATTDGAHPEFCSYRNRRGKRCDQLARWRERDGALGFCTAHRASAGLDDPA
ncbi:MAG: hypothetical protein ACHQZR_04785 [Candidatus Limnocylindrales bacterium]